MTPSLVRLAYICEFLLALLVITVVWGQVGGQDHLDLMPWYDKLVLTFAMAVATVWGTAAAVDGGRAWNARAVSFLLIAILIACAMGAVTYYYHLHENDDDEPGNGDAGVARLMTELPAGWTR